MSLIPYLFPEFGRPSSLFGQHFGLGLTPEDIYAMSLPIHISDHYLPLRQAGPRQDGKDAHKFQVCLDVHQFAPNEIKVKTIGRQIIVEAKHEERRDSHGFVARTFVRKYTLPDGYEPKDVVSTLSVDGVLSVMTPRDPIVLPDKNERIVPIVQTGPFDHGIREHSVEHEHAKEHHHKVIPVITTEKKNEPPLAIKYL